MNQTMRAAWAGSYGPPEVVEVREVPRPAPKPGEVLVSVEAAPVTTGDARVRGADVPAGFGPVIRLAFGVTRPRNPILGMEFAGRIAALGDGASGFAIGDPVFGIAGAGTHAEYVTVRADGRILRRPDGMSPEDAAAFFFGGITAADFLIDKGKLQAGERLLVNGASGSVGSAAVQIGRHLGARVTGVASAANLDRMRDLGAEEALDYRAGPIEGEWDVVMDVAGTLPWQAARNLLAEGGRLLPVTASLGATLGAAIRPRRDGRRVTGGIVSDGRAAMERLVGLHAAGAYRPVVQQVLPFERIRQAHALASGRHKTGAIVVRMDGQAVPDPASTP